MKNEDNIRTVYDSRLHTMIVTVGAEPLVIDKGPPRVVDRIAAFFMTQLGIMLLILAILLTIVVRCGGINDLIRPGEIEQVTESEK